jgi:AcrR family transcriptional regulator
MAEITAASGLQPSTMYQYFSNKDDIVWAIVSDLIAKASEDAKRSIEGAPNGLSKITRLLEFMADELSSRPDRVRFMAQFDAMYARDWPAERLLSLEAQVNPKGFRYFEDLIREGIADGSLRPDLDPELSMHAVVNAVIGAQRRLASLGNKVEMEYGQPIDRLFRETIRVILLGLRATETQVSQAYAQARSRKSKTTRRNP